MDASVGFGLGEWAARRILEDVVNWECLFASYQLLMT
jgi:hypothetical protein